MRNILYIIFLSFLINQQLSNDVRWVRSSSEYQALCHQIYNVALEKIDNVKINKKRHYAVILDLDETVLDNSQYQVELYENNETFNMDSWADWVLREEAKLVPGAFNYIEFVRKKNIQIIFLSNRMHERLDATKNNLKKLGIYSDNDIYLLRKNKADKKYLRREEIFSSTGRMEEYDDFIVLQYLGDAMGDFNSNDNNRFGLDQFIFPNPMYGKW